MEIERKVTKKFVSKYLTRKKYNELYNFAIELRDFRNEISEDLNKNILSLVNKSKITFINEMRIKYKGRLSSCFDAQLFRQLYIDYTNKLAYIQHKIQFKKIVKIEREFYKKKTADHEVGDLKSRKNIKRSTPLTICLTYLARYGKIGTVEYLEEQKKLLDKNKKKDLEKIIFYDIVIKYCKKYKFKRLYKLALERRENAFKKYTKNPIKYESLTFFGRSRKIKILEYNKNKKSKIDAFINLSGFNKDCFYIPVNYNNKFYGSIKKYEKTTQHYEYQVTFDEYRHRVRVHLCIDEKRKLAKANNDIVGIDVNVKHNLFSLSDGKTYDFDRKLLKDYMDVATQIDNLKSKIKDYRIGKRKRRKLDTLKNKIIKNEENLIAKICKQLKQENIHHVVLENIDGGFRKSFARNEDNNNVKYNRIIRFLGIQSIKDKFKSIANKYDIGVSLVHTYYTSRTCPKCGCIDKENRPTQEDFICIECGFKDNADHNAAVNIKNRVSVTVLQKQLLTKLKKMERLRLSH